MTRSDPLHPAASHDQTLSDDDLCALIEGDLNRLTGTLFVVGHFFGEATEDELRLAQADLVTMIGHAAKVADRVVTYAQNGLNLMPDAAQEDIMQAAGILASLDVLIATTDLEGCLLYTSDAADE